MRPRPAVLAGHGRSPNQSHASAAVTTGVTPVMTTAPCAAGATTSPAYMIRVYGAPRERGHEAVAPGDVLAVRVLVVERALLQLEDADIGDGAGLQRAEPACPPDRLRGVRRHRAHDVGQRHAEAQEFAHRGRQVL